MEQLESTFSHTPLPAPVPAPSIASTEVSPSMNDTSLLSISMEREDERDDESKDDVVKGKLQKKAKKEITRTEKYPNKFERRARGLVKDFALAVKESARTEEEEGGTISPPNFFWIAPSGTSTPIQDPSIVSRVGAADGRERERERGGGGKTHAQSRIRASFESVRIDGEHWGEKGRREWGLAQEGGGDGGGPHDGPDGDMDEGNDTMGMFRADGTIASILGDTSGSSSEEYASIGVMDEVTYSLSPSITHPLTHSLTHLHSLPPSLFLVHTLT